MNQGQYAGKVYLCPMQSEVRQANPGKCPKCGMDLLSEGTRFALLRHMSKSPLMIVVMAVIMFAIMYMVFM
jgi:hypothetical protein